MKKIDREIFIWDDREKLYDSYLYVNKLYNKYLNKLALKLNSVHNTNYSVKYWEILIGLWLKIFIQTSYEKFLIIKNNNNKKIKNIKLIIPNNSENFFYLNTHVAEFNESISMQILDLVNHSDKSNITIVNNFYNIKKNVKQISISYYLFSLIISFINKNIRKKIFVYDLPLNKINKIKFFFTFLNFPLKTYKQIKDKFDYTIDIKEYNQIRFSNLDDISTNNEFEKILNLILLKNIPIIFLERYFSFKRMVLNNFPKNFNFLYDCGNIIWDDTLKFLAAEMIYHNNVKLILHQHGGAYGMNKFNTIEDYEISIANKFLTWGWKNNNKKVISYYFNLSSIKSPINYNSKGSLLVAEIDQPEYTKYFYSAPISIQIRDEIELHEKFINNLKPYIKDKLILRRKFNYLGNFDNLNHNIRNIKIEMMSEKSFYSSLSNSRLFVATHNATTYLESFYYNIPTLILWKKEYREMRDEAIPYFNKLEQAEVLFYDPKKIAKKINDIFENPMDWWNDFEIQNVKNEFCDNFLKSSRNTINEYKALFND